MENNQKRKNWLAVGWVVIVLLWAWWEASHYAGLYRWLAEWQTAKWGQYDSVWTSLAPVFLLCAPAIAVWRRQELMHQAERAAGVDQTRNLRSLRKLMFGLGVVAALVAGGSYIYSQQLPDPSAPPVEVDLAVLGDAAPPTGSVAFAAARPDSERALQMDEQFRSRSADIDHQTIYVPVVVEGAAPEAPVRFFIDRASDAFADSREAPRTNVFLAGSMRGVLIENGLSADVVAAFARQGVTIASPHYLLTTNSVGARDTYYIVAAIGGMLAAALLLFAAIQSAAIARAERRRA